MAEITKIKSQKNKKRVNIYLDSKFAFGLPAETLVKAGLKVGQTITEKEVEDLIFKNEFQKLLDKALRLISRRPRSEKEARDYLNRKMETRKRKRDESAKIIEGVIKRLKKQKLIDDSAFASWWVEQRSIFRPRGKFGLTMELRQKGVDEKAIKKVVEEKVKELPLAKKAVQKKSKTYKNLSREEKYQKMTAFLSRRGFSWETIKTVIDEILKK